MTGYSFTTPVWKDGKWAVPAITEVKGQARIANGPEGQPRDAPVQWDKISWRAQEEQVRRLRQRIFKAAQEQDWPKVRNLPRMMATRATCSKQVAAALAGSHIGDWIILGTQNDDLGQLRGEMLSIAEPALIDRCVNAHEVTGLPPIKVTADRILKMDGHYGVIG